MEETLAKKIKEKLRLIGAEDKVLVAVSGGVDSMVLLNVLVQILSKEQIEVAHLNHQIREDSIKSVEIVENFCLKHNLSFNLKSVDITGLARERKIGLEECGREERYLFFKELKRAKGLRFIITAHTLDDLAETILGNISRGTFLHGLIGMRLLSDEILRPMLDISKDEILQFAKDSKIEWHEDYTNSDTTFTRNFLRIMVLKVLKNRFPSFLDNMSRFSNRFIEVSDYMKSLSKNFFGDKFDSFSVDEFLKNPSFLQKEIIATLYDHHYKSNKDVTEAFLTELTDFIQKSKTNSIKEFGDKFNLRKSYETINLVLKSKLKDSGNDEILIINIPGKADYKDYTIEVKEEIEIVDFKKPSCYFCYLDKDKVGDRVNVRSVENGDYFVPLGMDGKKKLSDYFTDEKIDTLKRKEIPIFESENNDIIWVGGLRIDDRYKVDEKTKNIIKISLYKK